MPAPHPPPAPNGALFDTVDDTGARVALRRPVRDELACPGCMARTAIAGMVARVGAETDLRVAQALLSAAERDRDRLAGLDITMGDDDDLAGEDPDLRIAPGEPGHSCADWYPSPVWILEAAGCHGPLAHALDGSRCPNPSACRAGQIMLVEVLDHLPAERRSAAIRAHLDALQHIYTHLQAAAAGPNGTLGPATCVLCLADPARHLDDLESDLNELTLELAPALLSYEVTIDVGNAREGLDWTLLS